MGKSNNTTKLNGQVFTPDYLVKNMLDYCDYKGSNILRRHVIDNSCGEGAFLTEVVLRYCKSFLEQKNDMSLLKNELAVYIHGIEIDKIAYDSCIENLNKTVTQFNIHDIKWDILNNNTLSIKKYNNKMDFVIGNPPYVRVHNLDNNYSDVKKYLFANGGMTDLYLVFFEIGFNMLKPYGKLCYITPSSWLTSRAAENMRKYLRQEKNIVALIDLEHFQPFTATAYTLISLFQKDNTKTAFDYYVYNGEKHERAYIDTLSYDEVYIGNNLYLAQKEKLKELSKIRSSHKQHHVKVKNGFATLADRVFIGHLPFKNHTIKVIKASTGKWYTGFFPYDQKGKPIKKEEIFSDKEIKTYLYENEEKLLNGRNIREAEDWYLYGRTQALSDVYVDKYSINTIIRDRKSIKLHKVPTGCGIYSGLYIKTNEDFEKIQRVIDNDDFLEYISILRNYKSGGYYTFNSKDLEQYLNYKLTAYYNGNTRNSVPDKQLGLFESDF